MQNIETKKSRLWQGLELFEWCSRVNRIKYISLYTVWWWASFIITILCFSALSFMSDDLVTSNWFEPILIGLCLILLIIIRINMLCLNIRRLHDCNAQGWWALFSLVPLVEFAFPLIMLFIAGTPAANRFGDVPLETRRRWWQSVEMFQGCSRTNRTKFLALYALWGSLQLILLGTLPYIVSISHSFANTLHNTTHPTLVSFLFYQTVILFMLLTINNMINGICLQIRRLHDLDYRGWWLLLLLGCSIIWALTNYSLAGWLALLWVVVAFVYLIFILAITCVAGSCSANRFGNVPPPPSNFCKLIGFTLGIVILVLTILHPIVLTYYNNSGHG